jgi:hypothetical protein
LSFFKRILGDEPPAPLTVDPCLGDAGAREWATRLDRGEDLAFRVYLAGETDTERRDFTLEAVLGATDPTAAWTDRWVAEEPASALAHMVRGRHLVHWAWIARSHLRAQHVEREQFELFLARLNQSWASFERSIELDSDDGSTYALMIDAAKGLQLGLESVTELYNKAQTRRPWQQIAHSSMVQALAKKWGAGSADTMLDFARYVTRSAPEGAGVHVVIPEAHVEAWMDADDSYWQRREVRDEVMQAAARSIDLPSFDSPWMTRVRSAFAYCYCRFNDRERARAEFERIGPVVAGPFLYSTTPVELAAMVRRQVGAT